MFISDAAEESTHPKGGKDTGAERESPFLYFALSGDSTSYASLGAT